MEEKRKTFASERLRVYVQESGMNQTESKHFNIKGPVFSPFPDLYFSAMTLVEQLHTIYNP